VNRLAFILLLVGCESSESHAANWARFNRIEDARVICHNHLCDVSWTDARGVHVVPIYCEPNGVCYLRTP